VTRPPFTALHALLSFALVFLAQVVAGFGVVFAAVIVKMASGENVSESGAMRQLTESLGIPLLLASAWISAAVLIVVLRAWAWPLVPDRTDEGLGLVAPARNQILALALIGVACAGTYLALISLAHLKPTGPLGPIARVALESRAGRTAWIVVALCYAPVIEELLFRGLMWRGLRASWGVIPAGAIVTLLFFALHLGETMHFWPAMIAIATLSVATLLARVRTGSVVASMVLHAAYNGTIAVAALLAG